MNPQDLFFSLSMLSLSDSKTDPHMPTILGKRRRGELSLIQKSGKKLSLLLNNLIENIEKIRHQADGKEHLSAEEQAKKDLFDQKFDSIFKKVGGHLLPEFLIQEIKIDVLHAYGSWLKEPDKTQADKNFMEHIDALTQEVESSLGVSRQP